MKVKAKKSKASERCSGKTRSDRTEIPMVVHLENELSLVARARKGDADSFTILVQHYERNIYRLAMQFVSTREDAEDVMQEAFLKAYANLGQFQGGSRFYTWLVRIAVNECLMKLRKGRNDRSFSLDEPLNTEEGEMRREVVAWEENPEQTCSRQELRQILNNAMAKLEPEYRVVVQLRDVEGLPADEVAEMLGLSIPAVKSRLLRGRLMLRDRLTRAFGKTRKPAHNRHKFQLSDLLREIPVSHLGSAAAVALG